MTRKVGKMILRVCEEAEALGKCTSGQLSAKLGRNVGPYCERAVSYGLMVVDMRLRPRRYTAVKGWRAQAEARGQRRQAPKPRTTRKYDAKPLERAWSACIAAGAP